MSHNNTSVARDLRAEIKGYVVILFIVNDDSLMAIISIQLKSVDVMKSSGKVEKNTLDHVLCSNKRNTIDFIVY